MSGRTRVGPSGAGSAAVAGRAGTWSAIAGADGCRDGWIVVVDTGSAVRAWVEATIDAVTRRLPAGALLAIDVPIGLPRRGDRRCCKDARRFLGAPRASSVFPVPVRACLAARTHAAASALGRRTDGRGVTRQAWSIVPKIREVDDYLRSAGRARVQLREIHPEVSFARWRGKPMSHRKLTAEGRLERQALIDRRWPGRREAAWAMLAGNVARDDLNDAFAALWSAHRIAAGTAVEFPATPELDVIGLPMRISS